MRLLNAQTKRLANFDDDSLPQYAILSHTWGAEEVTLQDLQDSTFAAKSSWSKIKRCCDQALEDEIQWIWADTCCIDKTSSSELSEAINSMFKWYEQSTKCYAYLADVSTGSDYVDDSPPDITNWKWPMYSAFANSRWFTRGWTLQELLAPSDVQFFSADWIPLGLRSDSSHSLEGITKIPSEFLRHRSQQSSLHSASVAQRMSWAAQRQTTRKEDLAYCLLGIFGVNMPMLYGEGEKAFIRLQEEIIRQSNDQTLLAWQESPSSSTGKSTRGAGALAFSPADFSVSNHFIPVTRAWEASSSQSFEMTKRGLMIELPLLTVQGRKSGEPRRYGILNCCSTLDLTKLIGIPLKHDIESDNGYMRSRGLRDGDVRLFDEAALRRATVKQIFIKNDLRQEALHDNWFSIRLGRGIPNRLAEMVPNRRRYIRKQGHVDVVVQMNPEEDEIQGWQRTLLHFDEPELPMAGNFPNMDGVLGETDMSGLGTSKREFTLSIFYSDSAQPQLATRLNDQKSKRRAKALCAIAGSGISQAVAQAVVPTEQNRKLKLGSDELVVSMESKEIMGRLQFVVNVSILSKQGRGPLPGQGLQSDAINMLKPLPLPRLDVMALLVAVMGLAWTLFPATTPFARFSEPGALRDPSHAYISSDWAENIVAGVLYILGGRLILASIIRPY